MQRCLPLLLALALATPAIAGEDTSNTSSFESVMTMRIDGDIEIAADGTVKSHTIDTELKPEMRSKMRIALVARQAGEDYVVEIENATFGKIAQPAEGVMTSVGVASLPQRKLPAYRIPANALITVQFHIDRTGNVLDVATTQCAITAMAPNQNAAYVCKRLERDSIATLKTWKFKVVPGTGVSDTDTITTALWFQVDSARDDKTTGKWRRETRSAYRPAPWRKRDEPRVGTADITDGGVMQPFAGLTLEQGLGRAL